MERTSVPRGKRPRVQVSMDDKERAIARIRKGETKAGISRELGVPESTVRGWVKRADQRMAREASEANEMKSSPPLVVDSFKMPVKRDHQGQQLMRSVAPMNVTVPMPLSMPLPMPVPMPSQAFQQAAESQLQLNGWLHIFNAGILNFTLIATAAFLRARARGTTDHQPLWQIICEYVDEAGHNVAANGGRYVPPVGPETVTSTGTATATGILMRMGAVTRQLYSPALSRNGGSFVAPRHITAEDDEDASMETESGPR